MHIFLTPCQHISELTTTTFMQSGNHVVNNKKHVYFFGSNIQIFHRGPGSHFSRALCLRFSIYLWQHARVFSGLPTITFIQKGLTMWLIAKKIRCFCF
jgi:hypothetical protein